MVMESACCSENDTAVSIEGFLYLAGSNHTNRHRLFFPDRLVPFTETYVRWCSFDENHDLRAFGEIQSRLGQARLVFVGGDRHANEDMNQELNVLTVWILLMPNPESCHCRFDSPTIWILQVGSQHAVALHISLQSTRDLCDEEGALGFLH